MAKNEQSHIDDQPQQSLLGGFLPLVSLFIKDDEAEHRAIINEEIANLCLKVQERKSIYSGAAEVGMSYGKAWRIIKETETSLGFPLFTREGCKGSALTQEAAELLDIYSEIQQALKEKAEQLCEELLGS